MQVLPGVTVALSQLSLDLANSDAFVPAVEIVPMPRETLPVFVMVNVCAEDELFTFTLPNALLVGSAERF